MVYHPAGPTTGEIRFALSLFQGGRTSRASLARALSTPADQLGPAILAAVVAGVLEKGGGPTVALARKGRGPPGPRTAPAKARVRRLVLDAAALVWLGRRAAPLRGRRPPGRRPS